MIYVINFHIPQFVLWAIHILAKANVSANYILGKQAGTKQVAWPMIAP